MTPLTIHISDWDSLLDLSPLPQSQEARARFGVTSRYLTQDNIPFLPVSGEVHYYRIPPEKWEERIALAQAGGITHIASCIPWIFHEPKPGQFDFTGYNNVARFIELVKAAGLKFIARIGPWCHAELRNGGFPDWVTQAGFSTRCNDESYLAHVRRWFDQLAKQIAHLSHGDGPVVAVQLENELYDDPDHIHTLMEIASDVGFTPSVWTATAWGAAKLPIGEVLPLYGGYGDGFWVDSDKEWDDSFRAHFHFSTQWDDPGIGADLRAYQQKSAQVHNERLARGLIPPATCEIGGGMAVAYHRRPHLSAEEIAAVANAKLGSGSVWQGYYMYAGGNNPRSIRPFQESHETGYPNDMPRFDYDFGAPIGSAGQVRPSHAELRIQHYLLRRFGSWLATLPTTFPKVAPSNVRDSDTLRCAYRGNSEGGILFINWVQAHEPLRPRHDVRFVLQGNGLDMLFPETPLTIPPGTVARWPIGLRIGENILDWATASLVTALDDNVIVLLQDPGIAVRISINGVEQTMESQLTVQEVAGIHILILPSDVRETLWLLHYDNRDHLFLSKTPLLLGNKKSGRAEVLTRLSQATTIDYFEDSHWQHLLASPPKEAGQTSLSPKKTQTAKTVPPQYGWHQGRESAPSIEEREELSAVYQLPPVSSIPEGSFLLSVDWIGDVIELVADGEVVCDQFWNGKRFEVELDPYCEADLQLRILPIRAGTSVWIPTDVREQLPRTGQIEEIRDARVIMSTLVPVEP